MHWTRDAKNYQFWNDGNEDGRFTITQARPGRYTLPAFADGVPGEFARTDLVVAPSRPAISRPASSMTTSASNWTRPRSSRRSTSSFCLAAASNWMAR
jgi:hypothetical protein